MPQAAQDRLWPSDQLRHRSQRERQVGYPHGRDPRSWRQGQPDGAGDSLQLPGVQNAEGAVSVQQRGTSLKGFIQQGQSQAKISLRLGNSGEEAFQPEVYGKSITIERTLNKDGGGSYKLKNSKDKTVSTRREDLQAMLDHWGIQPDSPLCILSQDNSRQFLAASRSREKYALFIRGTQLEQLSEDYRVIQQNIGTMRVQHANKKEILPQLHRIAKIQKERFNDAEKAQQQGAKLGTMRKELAWAYIYEDEEEGRKQEKVVGSEEDKLQKIQDDIARHEVRNDSVSVSDTASLTVSCVSTGARHGDRRGHPHPRRRAGGAERQRAGDGARGSA